MKIKVESGIVKLGRSELGKMFKYLEDGYYDVDVKEWSDARRNLQNKFIHLCFDVYGKEIGYSPEEAKHLLKKWFGVNGIIKDPKTGKQEPLIRNTSSYSVKECTVFIDRLLKHFEFDCGIIIDPELRKQYKIDEETGELQEI